MNLKLPVLTEKELGLLLALLRTQFQGPPTESGRKAGLQPAPVGPIRRLARVFEEHARKNKGSYLLANSVAWTPDSETVHVAQGVDKQDALERLTRQQWRKIRDELMRILEESHQIKWWGFRLPVMLPSKRVFVFRPEDLILNWLVARMIANNQQFRFVPRCRRCGRAGLRARGRRQNVYCTDECKRKDILERRRKERAGRRAHRGGDEEEVSSESVRVVGAPSGGR